MSNPEVGIIEIVDTAGRPVGPGVEGELICTGLQNMLQPLIRYRIGDTARWAVDQYCACGRHSPILEGIDGRVEDADGTTVGFNFKQNDVSTLRTHLDLELGIGWGSYLNKNKLYLDLSAGYGFQVFFDQNMFLHHAQPLVFTPRYTLFYSGNLYIQGLTASIKLDF